MLWKLRHKSDIIKRAAERRENFHQPGRGDLGRTGQPRVSSQLYRILSRCFSQEIVAEHGEKGRQVFCCCCCLRRSPPSVFEKQDNLRGFPRGASDRDGSDTPDRLYTTTYLQLTYNSSPPPLPLRIPTDLDIYIYSYFRAKPAWVRRVGNWCLTCARRHPSSPSPTYEYLTCDLRLATCDFPTRLEIRRRPPTPWMLRNGPLWSV